MASITQGALSALRRMAARAIPGALLLVSSTVPAAAQDRLQVHGFLTQGYGSASDYPIYGITTDGTGDYRTAALQGRIILTSSDHVVVQLSHQRLGTSNFMEFEDDVALDWLFYQKRFAGNSIRLGRVPMPRGLFNEVRDVGVILPFFRASKAFYSEGVETLEGATVSRNFGFSDWSVDATAFGGNFQLRAEVLDQNGLVALQDDMRKAWGGQLMLNTPIPGVRVGGTYMDAEYDNSEGTPFTLWTSSADASFERTFLRGEYEVAETDGFTYTAYYGQAGVNAWKGLWVNGQAEFNTNSIDIRGLGTLDFDAIRDYAVGLSYRFGYNLVLKAEWHDFEGYQVGVPVNPMGPPVTNRYFVLGVAASF